MIIFELVGKIEQVETIAVGNKIHDLPRLRKTYGKGRWRKVKGLAECVCLTAMSVRLNYIGMRRTASAKGK